MVGCGSDNSSVGSASRKDPKATSKQKLQVIELLDAGAQGGTRKSDIHKGMEAKTTKITPPDRKGGHGISVQELEAAMKAAKPPDPQMEIIPPGKTGERGLTLGQLEAVKSAQPVEPPRVVVPPSRTGDPGLTHAQLKDIKRSNEIDPDSVEVIPPSKPGGRGVTLGEIKRSKANQTEPPLNIMTPPAPPAK